MVLYKLSDNLTQALPRPFLVQIGFGPIDVGVATATIGLVATLVGTVLGGLLTDSLGLGRALWIFGFFQIVSNLGYARPRARSGPTASSCTWPPPSRWVPRGLGSGAFGVLLLRLTQKRFSGTQYALLSSLFTLPRVLAGPVAGVMAATIGWRDFFIFTVVTGVPGMVMLARFVPWGVRDPVFQVGAKRPALPCRRQAWSGARLVGAATAWGASVLLVGVLGGLTRLRAGGAFDLACRRSCRGEAGKPGGVDDHHQPRAARPGGGARHGGGPRRPPERGLGMDRSRNSRLRSGVP